MNYFNLYVALGVLLITVLAMNVSRVRIKEKIGNGDGNNRTLKKAIRAHMNSVEHIIPFALILFSLVHIQFESKYISTFAIGFIIVRILHSYSMLSSAFKIRQISAGLTYIFEIAGCTFIFLNILQA
jgi:uncharacterized membrane protein YecN with MAPEG domain